MGGSSPLLLSNRTQTSDNLITSPPATRKKRKTPLSWLNQASFKQPGCCHPARSLTAVGWVTRGDTLQSSLTDILNRCRAAIVGAPSTATTSALPATVRPVDPPPPTVRVSKAAPAPAPRPRPACASLDALTADHALAAGPARLLALLHETATSTATARGYRVAPSQVTIHQPQELLARACGVHYTTVWRWTHTLEQAGLVDARPHYTTSNGTTRIDGTLFAVSLQVGHRAHLTHDDLSHQWRDLDADRAAGRTAWSVLQGSDQRDVDKWKLLLREWAVTPGTTTLPVVSSDPCNGPQTVQDVAYMLPLLATAHPDKRPALVGLMASTLAHALNDRHSRRYWCKVIWSAWTADIEGRHGLQHLAAQLARLQADLHEWPGLRSPGALLASRLAT